MRITAGAQRVIATGLFVLAAASSILATEQATQSRQAEATPRSNDSGAITGTNQCEARTINYITDTLPQSCLASNWASAASPAVEEAPLVTPTESTVSSEIDASSSVDTGTAETPASTAEVEQSLESVGTESTTATFMSFEDWKEMMMQKTGQDPQDLKQRKGSELQGEERQKYQPFPRNDGLGDEGEISLNLGGYAETPDSSVNHDETRRGDEQSSEVGQPTFHRSKDAGKTCKERFSFASFDAGATILKTNSGAKNPKAILVENKDTYMLLECATPNKYVIIELTDDIWVDTIVLANFEFFSSMIRHFRVSVSDRYPVKMEKWKELGTFEARNSRDMQAFLVENPQIWAKFLRLEFLTHYGNEYYCPVSLVRVHGSRMLDKWKDSETGTDDDVGEIEAIAENHGDDNLDDSSKLSDLEATHTATVSVDDICLRINAKSLIPLQLMCPAPKSLTLKSNSITAKEATNSTDEDKSEDWQGTMTEGRQVTSLPPVKPDSIETMLPTPEISKLADTSSMVSDDELPGHNTTLRNKELSGAETASSSSPTEASGKGPVTSASNNRPRSNGTNAAMPPPPTMQEGFFNSVTKRLQQVEKNLTLSLKYVEEQSKHIQDAFQRSEQKQLLKISSVLTDLNQTVLAELRNFRDQYDQIWQSTVLALESQKYQSQRDILALSARLHVLADEVVFQKRMAIVQAVLLLSCLLLVIFSRGVPILYLGSPSDQGMGTSAAFAEILASMQRRDMYPSGSPRYPRDTRTPTSPELNNVTDSLSRRDQSTAPASPDDYEYQRPSPPVTPDNVPDSPIRDWQTSSHSSAIQAPGYAQGLRHLSSRKPLPALPEDSP